MGGFMNRGFTLVELLIALAVSGIIMTGVYSAFKTQQDSYLAQEQVAEMQQNLRASLYVMTREIRMAGYDGGNDTSHASCSLYTPGTPGTFGSSVAPGILAVTADQLDFSMDLNGDGDCADTGENLSYYIYTASDGIDKLGRRDNHFLPVQAVAESFEELEFIYLDSSPAATTSLNDIRSVQVSILAAARHPDRKYTNNQTYTSASGVDWTPTPDHLRRRFQTMTVKCRNIGLKL